MSSHVQNDPDRPITIADELESVLHVLIFFAVRFLHHNLHDSDVGYFLRDYFDMFSSSSRGITANLTKRTSIVSGAIRIVSYRRDAVVRRSTLRFVWPSEKHGPSKHPLNKVIDTLLSWFKAHYALDIISNAETDEAPSNTAPCSVHDTAVPLEEDEYDNDDDDDDDDDIDFERLHPAVNVAAVKKLARNLDTHDAFIKVLGKALHSPWPREEKVADKRPKTLYNPISDDIRSESRWLQPAICIGINHNKHDAGEGPVVNTGNGPMGTHEGVVDSEYDEEKAVEAMLLKRGETASDRPTNHSPPAPRSSTPDSTSTTSSRKRALEEPTTPPSKRSRG